MRLSYNEEQLLVDALGNLIENLAIELRRAKLKKADEKELNRIRECMEEVAILKDKVVRARNMTITFPRTRKE